MNWADWVIIGITVLSSLISVKRGFFKEALSLAIWGIAFFVAVAFYERLAVLLQATISHGSVRNVVSFIALLISTLIVGAMVNHLVSELIRITGLSGIDRLLGMVFGLARGTVIIMTVLILTPMILPVKDDLWWNESVLIPHFLLIETWCREVFAELIGWVGSFLS